MISKRAISRFLDRRLDNHDDMKLLTTQELDDLLVEMDFHPHNKPRGDHQRVCLILGALYARFGFLLGLGLGKTYLALSLFDYYRTIIGDAKRALILFPNSVLHTNWEDEVVKHTPGLNMGYPCSGRNAEDVLYNRDYDIVSLTYQGALYAASKQAVDKSSDEPKGYRKLDQHRIEKLAAHFDTLVCDESSYLMNRQSAYSRLVHSLSPRMKRVWLLTGTPFGHDPMPLWSQFYAIDQGATLGPTLGMFREAFFRKEENEWGGRYSGNYVFNRKMKPALRRMLKHRSIHYKTSECLDLPPRTDIVRTVKFPDETWAYYEKLVESMEVARGNFQVMDNTYIRTRQVCSGYLRYKDPENAIGEIVFKNNPKLETLMRMLDDVPEDCKVIIFYEYTPSGDIVETRLKKEKLGFVRVYGKTKNKGQLISKFKTNPSTRILLMNSKTGGHGLNLQVANYVMFFESPSDPKLKEQTIGRVDRDGQTKKTFIYDIVVKASIEEEILASIGKGRDLREEILADCPR